MVGLKVFFGLLELLVIGTGIYIFRQRKKLFGFKKEEGIPTSSANLRMMVFLIWIHAVLITALMIFEVG